MLVHKHLRRLGGRSLEIGDGPLGQVADRLVTAFRTEEADRLKEADVRASLVGKSPVFDVLQRLARQASEDSLYDCQAPMIMRFDAQRLLQVAAKALPKDMGVRRAKVHAYHLWREDPLGHLSVGQCAELRGHYMTEHPKSKLASVIDEEFPKIGFNTLKVGELSRIAANISDQESYNLAIRAAGLDGKKPHQIRSRAFIRGILGMVEDDVQSDVAGGGEAAANRTLSRFAADDEELLGEGEMGSVMEVEDQFSHDEMSEEIVEIESPVTGEELTLELGVSEESEDEAEEDLDVHPDDVEGLEVFGQLGDFAGDEDDDESLPMPGDGDEETSTTIEDPSSGEMLEVVLRPVEGEDETEGGDIGMSEPAMPFGGMENAASLQGQKFAVYAVSGGVKEAQPMDIFPARSVVHALRRLSNFGVSGEVRSNDISRHALIVVDAVEGDFLYVTAEEQGDEFEPGINEQQPDQMAITENDGRKVLVEDSEHSQKRPTLKVPHISKDAARKICAAEGLHHDAIEDQLLSGQQITAGTWNISLDENDEVVIERQGQKKTASMWELPSVIDDFVLGAAAEFQQTQTQEKKAAKKQREDAKSKNGTFELRPLFALECSNCGGIDEFVMPDKPVGAKCASCGGVTEADEIGRRIAALGESFVDYVITSDIPKGRDRSDMSLNARRLMAAIRSVSPDATGRVLDNQRLEVQVRRASERQLNRIRRVLEDQFGVGNITAATPVSTPMGVPTQHATPAMGTQPSPQAPQATGGPTFVGPPAAPQPPPLGANPPPAPMMPGAPAEQVPTGTNVQQQIADAGRTPARVRPSTRMAQNGGGAVVEEMGMEIDISGGPPPTDDLALPMEMGGSVMSPEEEEAVTAAFTHYRDMGLGVVEAMAQFQNQYKELLEEYGPREAPERHMFEGEIVSLSGSIYSRPGLLSAEAAHRTAEESGPEFKPSVNEQQDDYVNVPDDASQVLGPDSETDDSANQSLEAPNINEQVDTIAEQPGTAGADTSTEPDTETNDPGDFGAGSIQPHHPATDQQGVSLPNTDLGEDSDTGDNPTTKKWDSVSSGTPNDRSAQADEPYGRDGGGRRTFYLPES